MQARAGIGESLLFRIPFTDKCINMQDQPDIAGNHITAAWGE